MSRFAVLTILATMLLLGVACADDGGVESSPQPTSAPQGAQPQDFGVARQEEVVVGPDGTRPRQISITAAVPAQITVSNQSGEDCVFFIGEYVRDITLAPGEARSVSATFPDVANQPGTSASKSVDMGCQGANDERRGKALIEFKGIRPGVGQ